MSSLVGWELAWAFHTLSLASSSQKWFQNWREGVIDQDIVEGENEVTAKAILIFEVFKNGPDSEVLWAASVTGISILPKLGFHDGI